MGSAGAAGQRGRRGSGGGGSGSPRVLSYRAADDADQGSLLLHGPDDLPPGVVVIEQQPPAACGGDSRGGGGGGGDRTGSSSSLQRPQLRRPPPPPRAAVSAEAPAVKVADFGLSKHKLNSTYVSSCRDLRGTLPYMAPELVADPERVSEKADVWSLGVVMWELLTRTSPFQVRCVFCFVFWRVAAVVVVVVALRLRCRRQPACSCLRAASAYL